MTSASLWLKNLMLALGYGVCHQLPARSFIDGGFQQPVCARCSGIYIGTIFGLVMLFYLFRYRKQRREQNQTASDGAAKTDTSLPQAALFQVRISWIFWVFAALAFLAMAYDGFSSYLGFRPTTDLIRLITGLAVGGVLAPILFALLSETLLSPAGSEVKVLARPSEWLWYLGALAVGGLIDYPLGSVLGPVIPLLVTVCLVTTYALIVAVVLGLARRFEHRVTRIRDALLPALISYVGALLLLVVFGVGKALLLSVIS